MLLRPRQAEFVSRVQRALDENRNTLGVAPTGAGKTVMLSAAVPADKYERIVILQHRDELVGQNRRTYVAFNRRAVTGVVDAKDKQFQRPILFAMTQTLVKDKNLDRLGSVDALAIDEAHHAIAPSNLKIIDAIREKSPNVHILGVTATPARGDGKGLRGVFSNVADQIQIGELIRAGHLVKPRTFVVDLGVRDDLRAVRRTAMDFDMDAVAAIMDKRPLNDDVVKHWQEKAGDRLTVGFCSTVAHAEHCCEAFTQAGVRAAIVSDRMSSSERQDALKRFERRDIQVLLNVAILTEGWDCPPVACVILLRPSSHKSTMIQMIGRGLRTVDAEKYPGVVKADCVVLDFGTSTLQHGSLEQDVILDGKDKKPGEAPTKECPACTATVPLSAAECAVCGHEFPRQGANEDAGGGDSLDDFGMVEVDLLEASPFKWEDIWGDGGICVACAFESWGIALWAFGSWHAIGGSKEAGIRLLGTFGPEGRTLAIATADDWLNTHGDKSDAGKSKQWLALPPSDKQMELLQITKQDAFANRITRYSAACMLTWKFNQKGIRNRLEQASASALPAPHFS
jgi:DNA repair protein RadD